MSSLLDHISFKHGPALKNRFALAPLTNLQSHSDGTLSDEEYRWLTYRAEGGFGLTMTCAAHVLACGQGFPGQLGIFSDDHLAGLTRLAQGIRQHDSLAVVQLHHAGMRSPQDLIHRDPLCPSDNAETGAVAMSMEHIEEARQAFIDAAARAQAAGFDGIELHAAHGYLLAQFLSPEINQRKDEYGGCLSKRSRLLFEIIQGIRARCGEQFNIGVRISPERFGLILSEMVELASELMACRDVDYLDLSLWNCFKPAQENAEGKLLFEYFSELPRHDTRVGVAGKIRSPQEAQTMLDMGADMIFLGRSAILNHDFPNQLAASSTYTPVQPPCSAQHLLNEGVSQGFVEYLKSFRGLVET